MSDFRLSDKQRADLTALDQQAANCGLPGYTDLVRVLAIYATCHRDQLPLSESLQARARRLLHKFRR